MKSAYLLKAGAMEIREEPRPEPGEGEVLLRVRAVGVCGSDVHYYREGRIGDNAVTRPLIIGHEFAGQVEAVGPGYHGPLEPGARVAVEPGVACGTCWWCLRGQYNLCPDIRFCGTPPVHGAYRECMAYPARWCWPLPDNLDYAEGAMIEPLAVGVHAVDEGRPQAGDSVLIVGAGSIGLTVLQVAKASGVSQAMVSEPLPYRRELARQLGADTVIDPNAEDVVETARALTLGRGADVTFEAAGAEDTYQVCIDGVRRGGVAVFIGIPAVDRISLNIHEARRKGITIKNLRRFVHTYPRAIRLVASGAVDVKALVTHTFPLERITEAFELVAAYGDGVLKAVIEL